MCFSGLLRFNESQLYQPVSGLRQCILECPLSFCFFDLHLCLFYIILYTATTYNMVVIFDQIYIVLPFFSLALSVSKSKQQVMAGCSWAFQFHSNTQQSLWSSVSNRKNIFSAECQASKSGLVSVFLLHHLHHESWQYYFNYATHISFILSCDLIWREMVNLFFLHGYSLYLSVSDNQNDTD